MDKDLCNSAVARTHAQYIELLMPKGWLFSQILYNEVVESGGKGQGKV